MKPILLLGAAVVAGAAPEASAAELPRIHLEATQDGPWRVRYDVDRPVAELRLARNPDDSRTRRWRAVDYGFELVHVGGEDRIRRPDGELFTDVEFDVPPSYVALPKDYAPFSPYGDGGMLFHSGRFHACAGACPDDPVLGPWEFTVVASGTTRIVIAGEVHVGAADLMDSGDGTKVYVGRAKPLETRQFVAIVDDAFPAGVRERLFDLFPAMMEAYADRMGPLSSRPTLFASHDADFADGDGAQGGTLPGQVFVHLYGPGWEDHERDAEQNAWIPWFFAHEAAHLYQQRVESAKAESEAWIHEGGAEAFAALVLRASNVVPEAYIDGKIEDAGAECIAALRGRPLNEAAEAGDFDAYYACGLIIHLAIDGAVRRASGGQRDLFDVWRTYLDRVEKGDRWGQSTFLDTVADEGAGSVARMAGTLTVRRVPDPAGAVQDLIGEMGP